MGHASMDHGPAALDRLGAVDYYMHGTSALQSEHNHIHDYRGGTNYISDSRNTSHMMNYLNNVSYD
jgi:hypothetical protein